MENMKHITHFEDKQRLLSTDKSKKFLLVSLVARLVEGMSIDEIEQYFGVQYMKPVSDFSEGNTKVIIEIDIGNTHDCNEFEVLSQGNGFTYSSCGKCRAEL